MSGIAHTTVGAMRRVLVLAIAFGALFLAQPPRAQEHRTRTAAELMDAVMWGKEPIGGPFSLIDHAGRRRTDRDFLGKLLVVYFGYMSCPDICPTELLTVGQAVDKLGPAGERVQPLFITLDPERDTAANLADYVTAFHPRLIGLTGSSEDIRNVAEIYRVYYAKVAIGNGTDYTVDHTGFVYLMNPEGRYLGFLPPGTPADRMAGVMRQHLATPDKH
jgi:cytochrome oxidase Cu insertion factor (SCO1/SenC/PrrC family)